jgi:hypothetical protein
MIAIVIPHQWVSQLADIVLHMAVVAVLEGHAYRRASVKTLLSLLV